MNRILRLLRIPGHKTLFGTTKKIAAKVVLFRTLFHFINNYIPDLAILQEKRDFQAC